jgi:sporulation protein YlmC with PRC-barrel domain
MRESQFQAHMHFRAGKLYGMSVISADAWQVGRIHIALVGDDWNVAALEMRPERGFTKALGLRTRKEREAALLSADAIASVGNFVLLKTPVGKLSEFLIKPNKPPMALPWVMWMPVVSQDGQNLGIVEDAYIDTGLWKVDSLTFLLDRKPFQRLGSLNPAKRKRRLDIPTTLAILGDVILLKVRAGELKRLITDGAVEDYAGVGTPERA